jgi:hypothetical protein
LENVVLVAIWITPRKIKAVQNGNIVFDDVRTGKNEKGLKTFRRPISTESIASPVYLVTRSPIGSDVISQDIIIPVDLKVFLDTYCPISWFPSPVIKNPSWSTPMILFCCNPRVFRELQLRASFYRFSKLKWLKSISVLGMIWANPGLNGKNPGFRTNKKSQAYPQTCPAFLTFFSFWFFRRERVQIPFGDAKFFTKLETPREKASVSIIPISKRQPDEGIHSAIVWIPIPTGPI